MNKQPTTEKLAEATALLDLVNDLADQIIAQEKRLDTLHAAIRNLAEVSRRHDTALSAIAASVEQIAVRLCGPGVLEQPEIN